MFKFLKIILILTILSTIFLGCSNVLSQLLSKPKSVVTGGDGGQVSIDDEPVPVLPSYKVGGILVGNTGDVELLNNGLESLTLSATGEFTFVTEVNNSANYSVKTVTSPVGQTCTVNDGKGTIFNADVINILVVCSTYAFSISGTISGYSAGAGLVLTNNGIDDFPVEPSDGPITFKFPILVADGAEYLVAIKSHPNTPVQNCKLSNSSGTINSLHITNVRINCSAGNSITVNVNNLKGAGLILQNNAGNDLAIDIDGAHTFIAPIDENTDYDVTIFNQPSLPKQNCTVTNGSGSSTTEDISGISIDCITRTYAISGFISGINGTLKLQNNLSDDLLISADGEFSFPTKIEDTAVYKVTVASHPFGQFCLVSKGTGTIFEIGITDITITCQNGYYKIGGSINLVDGTNEEIIIH